MRSASATTTSKQVSWAALGLLLFNFPLLALWDHDVWVLGLPLFPLALFLEWLALIVGLAWMMEGLIHRSEREPPP